MDEDSDDALDALDHGALVALLGRLYKSAGEKAVSVSMAHASTDDELREAVRSVRRRIAAKAPSDQPGKAIASRRTPPRGKRVRLFCVVYTADVKLVEKARPILRSCGVPVVSVASLLDLTALAANATPSHLVIDERCGAEIDVRDALGVNATRVSVVYGSDAAAVLAAVAAIAEDVAAREPD